MSELKPKPNVGDATRVKVAKPRFTIRRYKCKNGHTARRLIRTNSCSECYRLNHTIGGRLQEYVGRPREAGTTYKGKRCNVCKTYSKYISTGKCVTCQRIHSFNYSRKLGLDREHWKGYKK